MEADFGEARSAFKEVEKMYDGDLTLHVETSTNVVRLAMPLQGNLVRTDCRCNSRNEERSPLKSVGVSTGF